MFGQGTPREAEALKAFTFVVRTEADVAFGLIAVVNGQLAAILLVAVEMTGN
jgi:hypothetical protein